MKVFLVSIQTICKLKQNYTIFPFPPSKYIPCFCFNRCYMHMVTSEYINIIYSVCILHIYIVKILFSCFQNFLLFCNFCPRVDPCKIFSFHVRESIDTFLVQILLKYPCQVLLNITSVKKKENFIFSIYIKFYQLRCKVQE